MKHNEYMTKNELRARMRSFAATMLDVGHADSLDPVVNLFLESLSEEIYKIAGEIGNIENRILDKLSSMLAPAADTLAKPAHCVLQAASQEAVAAVTTQTGFQYFDRVKNRRLSFYSACNTDIRKGRIRYFIHKGLVYTMEDDLSKTLSLRSRQKEEPDGNTFWLGLDLDEDVKNIRGLSFYFDLHGVFDKTNYLNLLPYTEWSIRNETMEMDKGLFSRKENHDNITLKLFSGYDLLNKINQSVKDCYDNHFLTITGDCFIDDKKETFPQDLLPYFLQETVSSMNKTLIWIKVTCPQNMTAAIIDSLLPSINVFPALNRELVSKVTEVKRILPVIPLNTGRNESFLSVGRVSDASGKTYYDKPLYHTSENDYGIYSLRRGGLERYGKREAEEYLHHVVDVLERKTSAFFREREDSANELKDIEIQLNRFTRQLSKKLSESRERYEVENYLLVTPEKENEVYFTDYWISNGDEANGIRSGARFLPLSDALSARSLSRTSGGKHAPRPPEKALLRKKSITGGKLLVTNDDIRNFCLKEFDISIRDARVSAGYAESEDSLSGFIRTTDVYLNPASGMAEYLGEKEKAYCLRMLKENSPATVNYRIFLEI